MYTLQECPICESEQFRFVWSVKDDAVSKETFRINQCTRCAFLVTSPRPEDQDLGKYYESDSYISHSDEQSTILYKTYQFAREIMLRRKWSLITKYAGKTRPHILDIGCGTGMFLQYCQKKGAITTGVEPSRSARKIASRNLKTDVLETIEQTTAQYDVVTLWHVLEHIPNLNESLHQIKTHLQDQGTLIIAVPNAKSTDARYYTNRWAGLDVPRHLWHFTPETMRRLLSNHKLNVNAIYPMKLDAFYVSLLTEKYRLDRFTIPGIIRAAYRGFISNISASPEEYSSLIYIVNK